MQPAKRGAGGGKGGYTHPEREGPVRGHYLGRLWKVVHWHHVGPKDNGGAHTPITDVRAIWKLLHEKNLINDDGKRLSRNYVKNCLRRYSEYGDPHHKEPRKSGAPATIPQRKWIKANQGAAPRASRSLLG